MAFDACTYFAALRPAEVTGLRRQDCTLPKTGWSRLTGRPRRSGTGGADPAVMILGTGLAEHHDRRHCAGHDLGAGP
jgi:hypothetical protein